MWEKLVRRFNNNPEDKRIEAGTKVQPGNDKKCLVQIYSEGELTGFADGLDMRLKRKKEVEDDSQDPA